MQMSLKYEGKNNEIMVVSFFVCPCGCGSYADTFMIECTLFEEEKAMMMQHKDPLELNPIYLANSMAEIFQEEGFVLVDIIMSDDHAERVVN